MPIEWLAPVLSGLGKIPGLARFVGPLIERRRLAGVGRDLLSLRFWSEGTLEPLKKIAEGKGGSAERAEILSKLEGSQANFKKAIERLKLARSFIAFEITTSVAQDLDLIIHRRIGPGAIRPKLQKLAEANEPLKIEAAALVDEISEFNRSLDKLHEAIRKAALEKSSHKATGVPRGRAKK